MKKATLTHRLLRAGAAALTAVGVLVAAPSFSHAEETPPLTLDSPSQASATTPHKIDVMGLWAHPDDDAGFTTPCGVWHDLYGVRCGIIMASRGEGGSNSVGPEAGRDLGLRRENEDRTSHVRSGTVDIFNIDRVDFYYNTSAPLTEEVWGHDETLRRTVRIIRETQPEILVGWPSALKGGHGNHQYAQGRMIWEAAAAAADPTMYPEQLTGIGAVEVWQVKKILAGGKTTGTGGTEGPGCNSGFTPAQDNPFTVVGTWTGYDSPYSWLEGNLAGIAAGTPKSWAQVGREGGRAHPTQERVMQKDVWEPTCQRYGVAQSLVPMQPNGSPESERDDAVLFGATVPDPGGMPLGTLFYPHTQDYFQAAGVPFTLSASILIPDSSVSEGAIEVVLPEGWTHSGSQSLTNLTAGEAQTVDFTITPSPEATVGTYKIGLRFSNGTVQAYNDMRVELVPAVEGRLLRSGLEAEYEQWASTLGTFVEGRSDAVTQIGTGESITFPVEVTNRSDSEKSGEVAVHAPEGFTIDTDSKEFVSLPPGASTVIDFVLTHTDPDSPGNVTESIEIGTSTGSEQSSETVAIRIVPTTVIPQLETAPTLSGEISQYPGTDLDISTLWEGEPCEPNGTDCGAGSIAKIGWYDDALYFYSRVTDDVAGGAVTPDRCFGHWITDSVEILLDPQSRSIDTSSTFKLGIFPYTNDPDNWNGNGIDGPCWSRDADNHQGFSSGPLAASILDAPNAEGVEVVSNAATDENGHYIDNQYVIEAKIPFAALPSAVQSSDKPSGDPLTNTIDPQYLGLNITPYDSDNQSFVGKSRTAWSAFGSQQSEPLRWGHAYLENYEHPSDAPTTTPPARIPDTALTGVESPQTIYQSGMRGGTISGVQPTQALSFLTPAITENQITLPFEADKPGVIRAFVWKGSPEYIPVWTSSCPDDEYGFEACSPDDGAAPPWAPDMGGRLKGSTVVEVEVGNGQVDIPLEQEVYNTLGEDSMVLVSFVEAAPDSGIEGDGVDAWVFPITASDTPESPDPDPEPEPSTPDPSPNPEPTSPPETGESAPGTTTNNENNLATTGATVAAIVFGALCAAVLGTTIYRLSHRERTTEN